MNRNKGGRPVKHQGQKIKQAHLRLTEEQHKTLAKIEKETGINRTDLFIKRVLEDQSFLITKDVVITLSELGGALGKVGNNINQLAKHANTVSKNNTLSPKIFEEHSKLMTEYLDFQAEIHKVLRQMYRVMKKPNDSKNSKQQQ
ncbi:plasmid mobilization relaxosome protein MobC (plasmid) [Mucilaginibacter robiniae]|uniref:Plasmid mobilization relaxosome protein MobC n=1 Tax=Mucilaginibacter robiniae TaxID=2728022 RepID=A0A7L5E6A1_9SPHI|nr:plasmid mobilization relaxosome protein MobC [Mucilaginibacter robiniae]QJD98565.1 plasmid mobilization relaxosome protein MobC [Mucilaginibacter robiniae]